MYACCSSTQTRVGTCKLCVLEPNVLPGMVCAVCCAVHEQKDVRHAGAAASSSAPVSVVAAPSGHTSSRKRDMTSAPHQQRWLPQRHQRARLPPGPRYVHRPGDALPPLQAWRARTLPDGVGCKHSLASKVGRQVGQVGQVGQVRQMEEVHMGIWALCYTTANNTCDRQECTACAHV
jgi:hypothetical protein